MGKKDIKGVMTKDTVSYKVGQNTFSSVFWSKYLLLLNTFVLFYPISTTVALMNNNSEKQVRFSALALAWEALLLILSPSCTTSFSSLLVPNQTP